MSVGFQDFSILLSFDALKEKTVWSLCKREIFWITGEIKFQLIKVSKELYPVLLNPVKCINAHC